jgi:hypothetical protein
MANRGELTSSIQSKAQEISGGASQMQIREDFWQAMSHLLLLAYVDYENQPD